jgi:geranylgeranyl diphosphate synthase type II
VDVDSHLKAYAEPVVAHLERLLPTVDQSPCELFEAIRYACLGEGKKIRPVLCLASCEAVGGRATEALDFACALEMVHCFSLVHDDLPALDNDDLRRGKPTCHKIFGEAVAILAGDALFNLAYEVASGTSLPPHKVVRCIKVLSGAVANVVAGETADILAEGKPVDARLLEFIHMNKTSALIRASCEIGAIIGTDDEEWISALRGYGEKIGLAFQIVDDILNETSTPEQLGKSAGSDRERGKATYPALFGLEKSKEKALELVSDANRLLATLPNSSEFLGELARYTVYRVR